MGQRRPRRTASFTVTFAAIDFETANSSPDSACAVGIVRVHGATIHRAAHYLIRPPTREFRFSHVHGITYRQVRSEATFEDVWRRCLPLLRGCRFLAAHNAPFDRSVLDRSCRRYGGVPPSIPFVCTMQLARRVWDLYPTRLPDVCRRLRIPLRHHDPLSDARACAQIVMKAIEKGQDPTPC